MKVGENMVQKTDNGEVKMDTYKDIKLSLKRLATEAKAKDAGLSPETCTKLHKILTNSLLDIASEFKIPPEELAQSLLKKWHTHRKEG